MTITGMLSIGLLVIAPILAGLTPEPQRFIIEGVDQYRNKTPFEGIRVILSYLGEEYSPAYLSGISGTAFRIGGPCACATGYDQAIGLDGFINALGYECEWLWLGGEKLEKRFEDVLTRCRGEIQANRPMLIFNTTLQDIFLWAD